MRIERLIYSLLIIVATAIACIHWRKAALFKADNEELRAHIDALETEISTSTRLMERAQDKSDSLRAQTAELMQLRNEVTQLRSSNKAVTKLTAENERLKSQVAQSVLATSAPAQESSLPVENVFRRESWSFAGYASPESALVSAIWAMKEGNP
jgi:cell shape-determining protein MreC